jgi:hypothetical protein
MRSWFRKSVMSKSGDITIKLVADDQPEFRREYVCELEGGFKVEVEMYTSYGRRNDSSFLRQRGDKFIIFDLRAVADKIIDRELYPRVQAAVDRILALDKAFIDSNPREFIDEKGVTWRRGDQ